MSRTIVVTGASRGIGRAVAERLLAAGHTVLGVSREPDRIAQDRYIPIALDLARTDTIVSQLSRAVASHPDLDAVVSNAGGPAFGHLEELSERRIREGVELNLTSHLLVARALVPLLKRHPRSDLVIMGSESALRGGRQGSVYCAAKFGLRGFAQSLREEGATSGLRVTIVNPGMVRTPFFDDLDFSPGDDPENAIAPADVADAVLLALDASPGTVIDEINLSPLKRVVRKKPGRD